MDTPRAVGHDTPTAITLVVNADDFGFSPGVNRAIVRAHHHGIVTSTSLMTRWPSAIDAVAMSRDCPRLGLGLHFDLGEWTYVDGDWEPVYEVVDTDDVEAVWTEINRQLDRFVALVGHPPTHLDSHQHTHLRPTVRAIVVAVARSLAIPVRHCTAEIAYCGRFYGQTTEGASLPDAISAQALASILSELPPGTTELACHPGEGNDLNTMYRSERLGELEALCAPSVRSAVESRSIALGSFADVASSLASFHIDNAVVSSRGRNSPR